MYKTYKTTTSADVYYIDGIHMYSRPTQSIKTRQRLSGIETGDNVEARPGEDRDVLGRD